MAAQVRHSIAADKSKFIIIRQVTALSRANPGVNSAFLDILAISRSVVLMNRSNRSSGGLHSLNAFSTLTIYLSYTTQQCTVSSHPRVNPGYQRAPESMVRLVERPLKMKVRMLGRGASALKRNLELAMNGKRWCHCEQLCCCCGCCTDKSNIFIHQQSLAITIKAVPTVHKTFINSSVKLSSDIRKRLPIRP